MSDTYDIEDRRGRLEQFAERLTPNTEARDIVPAAAPTTMPAVFGAQKVAVMRDERRVLAKIKETAAAAGPEWYYRFPVQNRKENRTDFIEGGTIKMANDLARIYGNCEVDCRVEDFGNSFMFYARFVDLETGFALTRPYQQRKSAAKLGKDVDRRADQALAIGASKAIRNVVLNALQTYADHAFDEAKASVVERIKADLPRWRDTVVRRLENVAPLPRVEAEVGRRAAQWDERDVARVMAMGKAISEGMASLDEMFPPLDGQTYDPDTGEVHEAQADPPGEQLERFADRARDVVDAEPGAIEPAPQTAEEPVASEQHGTSAVTPIGEIISEAMQMARDPMLKTPDRVSRINAKHDEWLAISGSETLAKALVVHASRVAQGELSEPKARQYLSLLRLKD